MSVSVRLIATKTADSSVLGTIAATATVTFGAISLVALETIQLEQKDSSGGYSPVWFLAPDGSSKRAQLDTRMSLLRVVGPLDYRLVKTKTVNSVEIVEYM